VPFLAQGPVGLARKEVKKGNKGGVCELGSASPTELYSFFSFFPCKPAQQACAKIWRDGALRPNDFA
jgi:hypothetical protein